MTNDLKISSIMSDEEKKMVNTACLFISLRYCPWFLKIWVIKHQLIIYFKDLFDLSEEYPELLSLLPLQLAVGLNTMPGI